MKDKPYVSSYSIRECNKTYYSQDKTNQPMLGKAYFIENRITDLENKVENLEREIEEIKKNK